MIDSRLILIEGLPGSGKSTTSQRLCNQLKDAGFACNCFLEWSQDHPIQVGDDLQLGQVVATSIEREGEVLAEWREFVKEVSQRDELTIIESRFWQTTLMMMYAAGCSLEGVIKSNQNVIEIIRPLNPALIYLKFGNIRGLFTRTLTIKNKEWENNQQTTSWEQHVLDAFNGQKWFTERGISGPDGVLTFIEEWAVIQECLFANFPFPKLSIHEPHHHWELTEQKIHDFLGLV